MTQYIFERFPNVSLLGTYVTFQEKGVVRELGKVFGLPKEEIDVLCDKNTMYRNWTRLPCWSLNTVNCLKECPII